jgi:hypothetical protein
MILIRLLLVPFKLAFALLGLTAKVGYRVGRMPVKVSARSARLPGFRGWLFFGLGVAVGLLVAPGPGRELRLRIQHQLTGGGESDGDLAGKVAFELAHAPRTWHLEQPEVTVTGGRVTLRGSVPAPDARDELARVAAAIPGVDGVENLLTVASAG